MTSRPRARIAIVGAGLGGLALAQALLDAPADVVVLERDMSFDAPGRQVRVHCDARLADLAADTLPGTVGELFTAAQARSDARHIYLDPDLRVTGVYERPRPEIVLDTLTTREVLAIGLAGRLRFGSEVERFADGTITLACGERMPTDLCVIASGSDGSDRRAAFASSPREVGLLSWYGCANLETHPNMHLPEWLQEGFVIAIGEGRVKLAIGLYEPTADFVRLAARHDGVHVRRYAFWNVIAPTDTYPVAPGEFGTAPPAIAQVLERSLLAGWHPWFGDLVGASDPATVGSLALRSSSTGGRRPPGARLTYSGDAGHQMLPAALSTFATFEDVAVLAEAVNAAVAAGCSVSLAADQVSDQLAEIGVRRVRNAEVAAAPAFGLDEFTT